MYDVINAAQFMFGCWKTPPKMAAAAAAAARVDWITARRPSSPFGTNPCQPADATTRCALEKGWSAKRGAGADCL